MSGLKSAHSIRLSVPIERTEIEAAYRAIRGDLEGMRPQMVTSAGDYTMRRYDTHIGITNTEAAREVSLVSARECGEGHEVTIKDESGGANLQNITLTPAGTETIDGAAPGTGDVRDTISTAYGWKVLKVREGNWF